MQMTIKTISRSFLQAILLLGVVSCGSSDNDSQNEIDNTITEITSVNINATAITMTEGEIHTIVVTVLPELTVTGLLVWQSSDDAVVTVNSNGEISAISKGSAEISIATTNGLLSDVVTVTVLNDENTNGEYTIDQSLSNGAQLNTIAFNGLAFITGNQCSDSFFPPGKVADFFGYQHLRDVTPNGMGHNTSFVTNSANNLLSILTEQQIADIISVAITQDVLVNQFALDRLPLMKAFRNNLSLSDGITEGEIKELNEQAVIDYAVQLQKDDAVISIQRAKLFGSILRTLSDEQRAFLDNMVEGGFASWPVLDEQIDKTVITHEQHVLVMTLASEMFGWYAGNIESDTYFAPERQTNYFGSFFMKDAPAMGDPDYTIDESITANKGAEFLTYLTPSQKTVVTNIVDIQYPNLLDVVDLRREISTELRKFLIQDTIDENKIIDLSATYGALDGANSYTQASRFSAVNNELTEQQLAQFITLRDLDDYPCPTSDVYIFSDLTPLSSLSDVIDINALASSLSD